MKKIIFLLVAAFSALAASAAELTNFAGTLMDPATALPVVGAKLSLVDPGEYFAVTEAGGRFVFRDIPAGKYNYLFVYDTDRIPFETRLIGRDIEVVPDAPRTPIFLRQLLTQRKQSPAGIAGLEFLDRRERLNIRPVLLREQLGLMWAEEYMSVPLSFDKNRPKLASIRLIDGSTGAEMPFQISNIESARGDFVISCVMTFAASLKPFENGVYAVCSDWREGFTPPNFQTDLDLQVDQQTGNLILSNSMIAIKLPPPFGNTPTPASEVPGPIVAVKGIDGIWFGEGRLSSKNTIVKSWKCEQIESGPLYKDVQVSYVIDGGLDEQGKQKKDTDYIFRLRLYSKREFVRVLEVMGDETDISFNFEATAGFQPELALSVRNDAPAFDKLADIVNADNKTLAVFRPWNPPGVRNSHNWYGLMGDGARKDLFGIIQTDGSQWMFSDRDKWGTSSWLNKISDETELRLVASKNGSVTLKSPFRTGTRTWAMVVCDKTKNWTPETLGNDENRSHRLNRMHIRLSQAGIARMGAMKLDRVEMEKRPRLILNENLIDTIRRQYGKDPKSLPPVYQDLISGSRINTSESRQLIINTALSLRATLLGTENDKDISGFSSTKCSPEALEPQIRMLVLMLDANAATGILSVDEREFVLSTLIVAASTLESGNYWAIYSHDSEQFAKRDSIIALISTLLMRHPSSTQRLVNFKSSANAMLAQLQPSGGIPMDPAQFAAALMQWAETDVELNIARPGAGTHSPYEWPAFVKTIQLLSTLTTPPDPRYGGHRLLPPIGRGTASNEIYSVFGLAAGSLSVKNPELAAQFAWAWDQAGRPVYQPHPLYRGIVSPATPVAPEPKAPEEPVGGIIPSFGALFRHNFNQPDESYLLLKSSPDVNSFHQDQGSLLFYAFGSPVLLDGLTLPEREGAWSHNVVRLDGRVHRAPGSITTFANLAGEDYAVSEITVESMSALREYTPREIENYIAAHKVPPPGHNADGSQNEDMLLAHEKLDMPTVIRRHVIFNRQRQYAVVLDSVRGNLPSEVFFNVLADDARLDGTTSTFAGPFGVDTQIHSFGTNQTTVTLHKDLPQRWYMRIEQPVEELLAKSENANKDEKIVKPEKLVEFLTVVAPSKRSAKAGSPGVAAPKVTKLQGQMGVKLEYGDTVRYIFLSEAATVFEVDGIYFTGTRGMVTIRPQHTELTLFDAGTLTYNQQGLRSSAGTVSAKIIPGGFISGEAQGNGQKELLFFGLNRLPRQIIFEANGQEYLTDGDLETLKCGLGSGKKTFLIRPRGEQPAQNALQQFFFQKP